MTRRESLRNAVLLGIGMSLGKLDALKASEGQLTVDLNQWGSVVFKYGTRTIRVPVKEVFEALAEGRTG